MPRVVELIVNELNQNVMFYFFLYVIIDCFVNLIAEYSIFFKI